MISLRNFINIYEGGQAGHMAHTYDYTDWTGNDLIELINNLFSGKIEHLKEKLDGMNIMATMNSDGEVVFIRNKSNLNSERGGMSIEEMAEKWNQKEHQKKVFIQAGEIITTIFKKLPISFFNPTENIRKVINCECIIAGKTNVMPYISDRVAFHGYKIYELENNKWNEIKDIEGDVDEIYKAAEGIEAAKPRPDLVIKSAEEGNKLAKHFTSAIKQLFKDNNCDLNETINFLKCVRFDKFKPEWIRNDSTEIYIFDRWFNKDKSFNASQIKKQYPSHYPMILDDNIAKYYINKVIEPLTDLFLEIGDAFINLLDGFTNSAHHNSVCDILKKDIQDTVDMVKKNGTNELQDKIIKNLNHFEKLGNKYNSAEGVVITYKGRRLKLTGSFAIINKILGARFEL